MHDVIVVGARCAGSPLAMLLAREGMRVLLVDRASFPADIPHGHFIHRHGPRRLREWGLLGKVAARTPAITDMLVDAGDFPLVARNLVEDDMAWGYGPRRTTLDQILIAAAAEQNKFVNLHTKAGEKEILDLLEKYDAKRAIIHWYSGPMDILHAMIQYGCYFTIGVEVLYSDYIKEIAKAVPDHLLLTETDNPGALRWLKKNDEVGMPTAIKNVVNALADLRQSTPEEIESLVQANFSRLTVDDPWLLTFSSTLAPESRRKRG